MASKGVIQNRLSQPLGSKYLSATDHTEVNCTELVAQEDTIITLLEGGDASVAATDVDYKSSMNLDGVTLKKGALIVSPTGEAFQNINISEGSALAYNSVVEGQKSVSDSDAAAFFERVADAGGSLSTTEQDAVNQLVLDMKANGIWDSMKAIYPMVGASAAACAQNLKSSSFTGTFTSGWTFASTGVTPNGTSAYMDTTFDPSTDFNSDTDISIGFYQILLPINQNTGFIGSADAGAFADGTYIIVRFNDNKSYNRVSSSTFQQQDTTTFTDGFYTLSRDNISTFQWYKNSSLIYNAIHTATGRTNNTIYVGAGNYAGSTQYGGGENRLSFIGDSLSSSEVSDFYDAVQAFQTTLGREV